MLLYYTVNMFTTYEQAHANNKENQIYAQILCDLVIKMILRKRNLSHAINNQGTMDDLN